MILKSQDKGSYLNAFTLNADSWAHLGFNHLWRNTCTVGKGHNESIKLLISLAEKRVAIAIGHATRNANRKCQAVLCSIGGKCKFKRGGAGVY